MNDIQIDYATLVEVMTEECQSLQSQLLAMKSKLKIYHVNEILSPNFFYEFQL